jgi:hypothetical protein
VGVREQAQDEPHWFAFRTDVSLRAGSLPRKWLTWSLLLVAICGCAALYGALVWLVSFDAAKALDALADLSRVLGLLPP